MQYHLLLSFVLIYSFSFGRFGILVLRVYVWWRKMQHLLQAASKESRQLDTKAQRLPGAFRERFLNTEWGRRLQGLWSAHGYLLIGVWWGIRNQCHQASRFYVLVGSTQLASSPWWGFLFLQNSTKDLAQNIINSSWEGSKCPWLCWMVITFSCLTVSLCFCIFSLL